MPVNRYHPVEDPSVAMSMMIRPAGLWVVVETEMDEMVAIESLGAENPVTENAEVVICLRQ